MQEEFTSSRTLSSWFNKKFLQFASSSISNNTFQLSSPGHHRSNSSPSFMSPTKSQVSLNPGEEFFIGCSVCGTKAIEETCYADHPNFTKSIDDPNSGAYARIIAYYEKPLQSSVKNSTELKNVIRSYNDPDHDRQFESVVESKEGSQVSKTIVYKEFSPPGKNPLTPLNHQDKQAVKDCFFTNNIAKKFVKEEERKIVATRRSEYQQRGNGEVKTFVRTDIGDSKSKMLSRTASESGGLAPLTPKPKTVRGRKQGKKDKTSEKESSLTFRYKISREGSDLGSNEIVTHFEMGKSSSRGSLRLPSGKQTPSGQSVKSNKSGKNLLQVPELNLHNRSKNPSPSGSKNPSRGPSPLPSNQKANSRSITPVSGRKTPGAGSKRSVSPINQDFLSVPVKSRSSRSSSFDSDVSMKSGKSSKKSAKSFKSDKNKIKHVDVAYKTRKIAEKLMPLPRLFEPRSLREVFVVQKIGAMMIQRWWRKIRENKKKINSSSQWEKKDVEERSLFDHDELIRAMKLLGNFAEYVEKTGRRII